MYLEARLLVPLSIEPDRWQLPLGPTELPLLLTAISRHPRVRPNHESRLARPGLISQEGEYQFALTMWAIELPDDELTLRASNATVTSIADKSLIRLAKLNQLIAAAEASLAELPPEEQRAWKQVWSSRLREESARLEKSEPIPALEEESHVGSDEFDSYQQLVPQAAQLLGRMAEPEGSATPSSNPALAPFSSAGVSAIQPERIHFLVSGSEPRLALERDRARDWKSLPRVSITLLALAVAAGLIRWENRINLWQTLSNHPRWLVALLGLAWWLFFEPTSIGIALLMMAVLSWAVDRWHRHRFASTGR